VGSYHGMKSAVIEVLDLSEVTGNPGTIGLVEDNGGIGVYNLNL